MTVCSTKAREGYDFWDKLCAIPRYGFIHSPDNSRIIKAEGIGNWIDMHAAQEVVDAAQDEVNGLRAEKAELLEALGLLMADPYLIDNEYGVEIGEKIRAAIAKAKGESTC